MGEKVEVETLLLLLVILHVLLLIILAISQSYNAAVKISVFSGVTTMIHSQKMMLQWVWDILEENGGGFMFSINYTTEKYFFPSKDALKLGIIHCVCSGDIRDSMWIKLIVPLTWLWKKNDMCVLLN